MKISTASALLFPSLILAHIAWQPQITSMPSVPTTTQPIPSQQTPTISTIPSTLTSIPSTTQHAWDPIISGAAQLLDEIDEHLHIDLRKRQGAIGATNAVTTTPPSQMPATTLYDMRDGKPLYPYTQLFTTPLNPWPAVSAGTVGLGSIQGQVGVVKTNSKRAIDGWAEPTPAASSGQVVRIKGREVTMT